MKWLFVLLMVSLLAIPIGAQDISGEGWLDLSREEQMAYLAGLRAGMKIAGDLFSNYLNTCFASLNIALHGDMQVGELAAFIEAFLQKFTGNMEYPLAQLLFIVQEAQEIHVPDDTQGKDEQLTPKPTTGDRR